MTRHQVYLEGVKNYFYNPFNDAMIELRREFRQLFFDDALEYDKLQDMTKRRLEQFITALRTALLRHYNRYMQQVLDDLEKFVAVDTHVNAAIMDTTQEEDDSTEAKRKAVAILLGAGQGALWASVLDTVIPANGVLPADLLQRLTDNSAFVVESELRKAVANGLTPKQALAALLGTPALNLRDGAMTRFGNQADAVTATLVQHAASIVQAAVASNYFDWYVWVSVIDGKTSEICLSRNGVLYRYGVGPLPPAHMRCRSKTVPANPGEVVDAGKSYGAWYAAQPSVVRDDMQAPNADKFQNQPALTPDEFAGKLRFMLARG